MGKRTLVFPTWHNRLHINEDDYNNRVELIKSEFEKKINFSLFEPDKHNILIKYMVNHIRDDDKRDRINYNYEMKKTLNVFLKSVLNKVFTGCNTWCNHCHIYGPFREILEHMIYSHKQKNILNFCPFCFDKNIDPDKFDITDKNKDTSHILLCAIRVNHPTFKYFDKLSVHIWKVFWKMDKKFHSSRPSAYKTLSYYKLTTCDPSINFASDPEIHYNDYLSGYVFARIEENTIQIYKSRFKNEYGFVIYDTKKLDYYTNNRKRKNVGTQVTLDKRLKKSKAGVIHSIIQTEVTNEDCMCNIENNIFYEITNDTCDSGFTTDYEDEIEEQLKKIFERNEQPPNVSIEITQANNESNETDKFNITYNVSVGNKNTSLTTQFVPTPMMDNRIVENNSTWQNHESNYGIQDAYSVLYSSDPLNEININALVCHAPIIDTRYYNNIVDEIDLNLLNNNDDFIHEDFM